MAVVAPVQSAGMLSPLVPLLGTVGEKDSVGSRECGTASCARHHLDQQGHFSFVKNRIWRHH